VSALKEDTQKMLKNLELLEAKVLHLRFGIEGHKEHTVSELGINFGVSPEELRRIEAKALRALRKSSVVLQAQVKGHGDTGEKEQ
jgi:RNA polymerase primary sigma factor